MMFTGDLTGYSYKWLETTVMTPRRTLVRQYDVNGVSRNAHQAEPVALLNGLMALLAPHSIADIVLGSMYDRLVLRAAAEDNKEYDRRLRAFSLVLTDKNADGNKILENEQQRKSAADALLEQPHSLKEALKQLESIYESSRYNGEVVRRCRGRSGARLCRCR